MFEVFLKEIRELLRDRKTLFFVIALPMLVFPVIMALVGFMASQAAMEAEQEVHTYFIVNEAYAEQFSEQVFYHKSFKSMMVNANLIVLKRSAMQCEASD